MQYVNKIITVVLLSGAVSSTVVSMERSKVEVKAGRCRGCCTQLVKIRLLGGFSSFTSASAAHAALGGLTTNTSPNRDLYTTVSNSLSLATSVITMALSLFATCHPQAFIVDKAAIKDTARDIMDELLEDNLKDAHDEHN